MARKKRLEIEVVDLDAIKLSEQAKLPCPNCCREFTVRKDPEPRKWKHTCPHCLWKSEGMI